MPIYKLKPSDISIDMYLNSHAGSHGLIFLYHDSCGGCTLFKPIIKNIGTSRGYKVYIMECSGRREDKFLDKMGFAYVPIILRVTKTGKINRIPYDGPPEERKLLNFISKTG